MRRFRLDLAALSALVLLAAPAAAAPKDAAARKLDDAAMTQDYLVAKLGDARKKLEKALAACGESACSPEVAAHLHLHLGIVYLADGKRDEARAAFVEALKVLPGVQPEKDLASIEVSEVMREAEAGAGRRGPKNQVVHAPVTEQTVRTPVPVYVELPEDAGAKKVVLRYRGVDTETWETAPMKQVAAGWGGEIPCHAVAKKGEARYFVQALDGHGDVATTAGSRAEPFVVAIKKEIASPPPHQPGEAPPDVCSRDEVAESRAAATTGGHGAKAAKSAADDAPAPPPVEERSCEQTSDCNDGEKCEAGVCHAPPPPMKKVWLSFAVEADFAYASGADVCTPDSQANNGYMCVRDIGDGPETYHGSPILGMGDKVPGQLAIHTARILVGADYVVTSNLSLGARAGFAFGGGPQADTDSHGFLPLHAEARASWFFGKDPFTRIGARPFVFVAAGAAQVDSRFTTYVQDDGTNTGQAGNPTDAPQQLTVWKKMGQSFGALGGGLMWATSPHAGFVADVKLMRMLPSVGTVLAPSVGYAFAL